MKFPTLTRWQWLVHLTAWIPLILTAWDAYSGNLTINPIQAATQRTGQFAITLLVLSLACTPLNTLFGWRTALKLRRPLGLYAFMYAAIHLTIFLVVDYGLNWDLLKDVLFEKAYIIVGLSAFTILLALAATSFKYWQKRLGKNWKRLHQLVYAAGVLVVVHYFWAVKGDWLSLSGDILRPLLYAVVVTLLLLARINWVKGQVVKLRTSLSGKPPARVREQGKAN